MTRGRLETKEPGMEACGGSCGSEHRDVLSHR